MTKTEMSIDKLRYLCFEIERMPLDNIDDLLSTYVA